MTWTPGQPVATAADVADWQAWRKARKLEQQRERRASLRRIDYHPGAEAQAVIDARCGPFAGGDYSAVIDALVLAGAAELPE
ncbi:MAG TPA: hypothetical protein VF217_01530 [Rhodanobacteraceae bacterium]